MLISLIRREDIEVDEMEVEVNESEVESSFIPYFVSQCLDASSKAPECIHPADARYKSEQRWSRFASTLASIVV